jgi:epsilon-lactone hydrolase
VVGRRGANLAAALVLRAKDEGLPPPAALVLLTPAVDLTRAGDTYETNDGVDTILTARGGGADIYSHGHDQTDPYLSPLFGDLRGFPPTLIASGTRDRLLSDAVRMHRKLRVVGVTADLHVLEAAPHGFFLGGTPEDDDLDREVRQFVELHCPVPRETAHSSRGATTSQ